MSQTVWVLVWKPRDSTENTSMVIRVYTDKERADEDYRLLQSVAVSGQVELADVPLVGALEHVAFDEAHQKFIDLLAKMDSRVASVKSIPRGDLAGNIDGVNAVFADYPKAYHRARETGDD